MKIEFNEELNELSQQEKDLAKGKEALAKKAVDKILDEISKDIARYAGQKFAVIIKGTFTWIKVYGIISNQTETSPFEYAFVGRLRQDAKGLIRAKDQVALLRPDYKIPATKVFGRLYPNSAHFIKQEKLCLSSGLPFHDEPNWTIADLLPKDFRTKLRPKAIFSSDETFIDVFIGDEAFEEFLSGWARVTQSEILALLGDK